MTTAEKPLTELMQELPPELQAQVRTYVTQLLYEHDRRPARPLQYTCAGALRELRGQTTSVELQHQASEWMIEGSLHRSSTNVSD